MTPLWRDRLFAGLAAVLSIWLGFGLADGSYAWPVFAAAIALGAILHRLVGVPLDALALGGLLVGYLVGNRGFAQLMLVPGFPLLPAEFVLLVLGGIRLFQCALARTLPWRPDPLHYVLLVWIAFGSVRALFDVRTHGLLAVRDFAMVYYVAFFFFAQHLAADARVRTFLLRCLLAGSVGLPFLFLLSETFPEFFLGTLTFRGVPLIYFKGDLAPTFINVAALLLYLLPPPRHRLWTRPLATVLVLWVLAGDNRASMLGAAGMLAWMAFSPFRRFTWIQVGAASLGLLLFSGYAALSGHTWAERRLEAMGDRALSILDVSGQFSYRAEESAIRTDNNRFRWVWWRTVAEETLATNPALGLGFGHDLARGFLQEYNPDMAEDFTARSPHNILVTIFGRLGFVGLALFLVFLLLLFARTRRVVRDPGADPTAVALWVAVWPIAIAACFGVVLEGPMGAVLFWTLLGLAQAASTDPSAATAASAATTSPAAGSVTPAAPLPTAPAPAPSTRPAEPAVTLAPPR